MINFSCPSCSKKYKVKLDFAGKKARCKECGSEMRVPNVDEEFADTAIAAVSPAEVAAAQSTAQPPSVPRKRRRPASDQQGSSEILKGDTPHFSYEISQRPDFAMVTINLEEGQKIYAEPSAMASMTPSVTLKAGFKGGLGKTLGRAFGGESMIINTFTADKGPGEVTFAAGATGDAAHYTLAGNTLMLQRGAFMLHSEGVEVTGKWQGAKGFFGGEGLVLLKASGDGEIFFNSYGAILSVDVKDEYIVDSGYVVAFEDTLNYHVSVLPGLRAGGGKLKQLFFGGEGLVCRFAGQGRVWIQTRHVQSFLSWANAFRPAKSK